MIKYYSIKKTVNGKEYSRVLSIEKLRNEIKKDYGYFRDSIIEEITDEKILDILLFENEKEDEYVQNNV